VIKCLSTDAHAAASDARRRGNPPDHLIESPDHLALAYWLLARSDPVPPPGNLLRWAQSKVSEKAVKES
jgi:hypothetical protein